MAAESLVHPKQYIGTDRRKPNSKHSVQSTMQRGHNFTPHKPTHLPTFSSK
uniref:Uncharacterized protein n=1 Tax=Anopheles funestus TaxID=62324 RepID=A0A4Y0BFI3_ANOFN